MVRITILFLVFQIIVWKTESSQIAQQSLPEQYESSLNSSIRLEKDDKELRSTWTVDLQVQRINVTMRYRMEMLQHQRNFHTSGFSKKWSECLFLHKRQIRKGTREYYSNESECLTTNTQQDADNTHVVEQLEKEIRKWRKGYRYLLNKCKADNPDDEEAAVCLVDHMERDSYSQVIQRLTTLKLEAMGQLYLSMRTSLSSLEACLKDQLLSYADHVRTTMDTLNKCYNLVTGNTS